MVSLRCTSADEMKLGEYLLATPVASLGRDLLLGKAGAWHATIADREALGSTLTLFGDLGTANAMQRFGREKFRVRDVLPVLRGDDRPAEADRADIEAKMAAEQRGDIRDRTITAVEHGRVWMLADGNRRAIAIHEVDLWSRPLPVYLVRLLTVRG